MTKKSFFQATNMKSLSMALGRDVSSQFLWAGPCQLQHTIGRKVPPHFGTRGEDVTGALGPGSLGGTQEQRGSFISLAIGPITRLFYSGKHLHNCIIIDAIYSNFRINHHHNMILLSNLLCAWQATTPGAENTEVSRINFPCSSTTICVSICQLIDIWGVFSFWLWWKELLRTLLHKPERVSALIHLGDILRGEIAVLCVEWCLTVVSQHPSGCILFPLHKNREF